MPTKSFNVHIDSDALPADDKKLTVDVSFSSEQNDVIQIVNVIIVNGTSIEILPYRYLGGAVNKLNIVNMSSANVGVIFSDPVGTWIENFSIANPVLISYKRESYSPIIQRYSALHNFVDASAPDLNDDRYYNSPFNTTKLNLSESSVLDIKLQPAYDGSVNMIWTDDSNPIRIVNSRFAVDETGTIAELIDRRARKDANTYNDVNFHQTELIPKAISIPTLTFNGLTSGGILPGGGYKYFFKYITADGAETDIIEESRLVSVHDGSTTTDAIGSTGVPTSKGVSFTLTDLDQSFYGVVLYYTISAGDVDSVSTAFRVLAPFIIENEGICSVIHTGFEGVSLVDIETLSLTYSIISRAKTLAVVNNRLIVGNTDAEDVYDESLAQASSKIGLADGSFQIQQESDINKTTATSNEDNYSNPEFIYNRLGYWKGETYELGIVYVTEEGLSPVYTLQGLDNIEGGKTYNEDLLGGIYRGFAANGQNAMGIYRTTNRDDLWTHDGSKLSFSGTNMQVDVTELESLYTDGIIKGFFFVRRLRKKDVMLQGLLTPVAAVPVETKFGAEYEISTFGNWCGIGVTSDAAKGNVKYVPAPGGMMPFGVEEIEGDTVAYVPYLDPTNTQITHVGPALSNVTHTLTYVDTLKVGDSLKFVTSTAAVTGTIQSISLENSTVTFTSSLAAEVDASILLARAGVLASSTDFYIKAPIKDYTLLRSWSLYSPDTECAPTYYASVLSGAKIGISCTKQTFSTSQVNATAGECSPIGLTTALYHKIDGPLDATTSSLGGVRSIYASYVDSGATGVAPKGFSGTMDRNLYCTNGHSVGSSDYTLAATSSAITAANSLTTQFPAGQEIDSAIASRPGNALSYGRYIGIKSDEVSMSTGLTDLTMPEDDAISNLYAYHSLLGNLNAGAVQDAQLGFIANLYSSPLGNPLTQEAWKSRYLSDEDTEYSAISERYRIEDFFGPTASKSLSLDLYGGDCFLGMSWKQVWHPLGIAEAPQSNDITAYKTTRRSLGLLPYGYAIPIPAQSNYNFNIRSKERVDEREHAVYGTDRSFLPIKGVDAIRGNRQFETGLYNHGYNSEAMSAFKQFRLNLNAPFYRFRYPNRVYVSSESSENEFVNGYTNFKGLNYRDYNTNLGAITKLIALNNVLISVFKDGVAKIGVDERSMVSQDTGGVFVDAAQVLSRADVINSDYGSDHLHSICTSNNFAYGVDFTRLKIWRTNGEAFEIISDLKMQNKLGSISKEIRAMMTDSDRWVDVYSHFDSRKNEIYFSFVARDPDNSTEGNLTRTIVYNETIQLWVAETDDTRKFVFQSNGSKYAFPSVVGKYSGLYKYNIGLQADVDPTEEVFGEYNKFYDTIYDMYYDYHVIDEPATYKLYNNISIVGNNSLPTKITYTSDHNSTTEQNLKPYTNIRYPMVDDIGDPFIVNGESGTQRIDITQTAAQVPGIQSNLTYGHFISVIDPVDPHITYRYIVIEYVPDSHILVDKLLTTDFVDLRLYYGYGSNYPMRLTDSSFEESYGSISCQFNNRTSTGMSPAKLRGKWMRFRHTYEGSAPVYISGIITDYAVSLS